MKKYLLFLLFSITFSTSASAETVKNFLQIVNGEDATEKVMVYSYWRGMLDSTMYLMHHKMIRCEIPDQPKICPPKEKFPSEKEFFEFYNQYVEAEIDTKGREIVEAQQMDQIMMKMWFALFNCENPIWKN